jgi:hypothetical protein
VQQLDDDEFGITLLSLDQVLQLQKWILAQCCAPLECSSCALQSATHTVLLIICDRLAEMFECIHKRINKFNALAASDASVVSDRTSTPSSEGRLSPGPAELSSHIFCGTSGVAAGSAACNPQMFSSDFGNLFSNEEQLHMIRVLLRLQARNFRSLLTRIQGMRHNTSNQARQTKIKTLIARLSRASSAIDVALQVALQSVAQPQRWDGVPPIAIPGIRP